MSLNFLAIYSDHLLILLSIATVLAWPFKLITKKQALFTGLNSIIAWLLGFFVKSFYWLPRPYILSGVSPKVNYLLDGSFPSNHALFSLTIAFSVFIFNRRLGSVFLLVSFLISIGRIIAQVHSLFDILGAAIIAFILVSISKKWFFKLLPG